MSTVDELEEEIASLAAHLDAATARLLSCIRGFDEQGGWEKQGAVSCAHWLSWRIGVDLPTAREKVRVARALASLPAIEAALTRGELSYAKVRALTRVATPENEPRLLELAQHATGAQLERICRGYRQVAASLLEDGPVMEERSVREILLPGGMVRLELVLHPDEAALVRLAIDKARDTLREERGTLAARRAGTSGSVLPSAQQGRGDGRHASAETPHAPEAPAVSLADAAVAMAERALAADPAAGAGNGGERYQLFVHLDEDVLGDDGAWKATLDDGTRLPAETLRRLACDCGLVATRTDGAASVLDVGRRTRSIPPGDPAGLVAARPRLPVPWLWAHALPARPPRPALARRRPDPAGQPGPALLPPPPPAARGRLLSRTRIRRRPPRLPDRRRNAPASGTNAVDDRGRTIQPAGLGRRAGPGARPGHQLTLVGRRHP